MNADPGQPRAGSGTRAWMLTVALALLIVAFGAGSGSVHQIKSIGLHLRWVALLGVCLVAALLAFERRRRDPAFPSGLRRFALLAGGFLGLGVLSTAWSVAPRLTFERAGSLGLLFLTAALLAYATDGRPMLRRAVLAGIGAGAIAVGLLGVLLLVVDYDAAAQRATAITPWRYRGFMENPNTISVLAAVSLPIVAWLGLTAATTRARALWWAGGGLLYVSVVAAESRGGLIAATVGLVVFCLCVVRPWRRLAAAAALLVVALVAGIELRVATDPGPQVFVSRIPVLAPLPSKPRATNPSSKPHRGGGSGGRSTRIVHIRVKTHELPGEDSEIGHPLLSRTATSLAGSGRVAEWKGVLKQVRQRPLLGYGFGTEERVFVDRWYYFQGGTAENSYLGLLLQLGAIGAISLLGLGVVLVVTGVRAMRSLPVTQRGEIAAELGVLVAAAALMFIQSYIYSVGNVASGTVWLALFLLGANTLRTTRGARV
jgi:hypothetical protein